MKTVLFSIFITLLGAGCAKLAGTDIEETGQQIADVMASIDEAGGSNGSLGVLHQDAKVFERYVPGTLFTRAYNILIPEALATACSSSTTFSSCSSNTITRTFNGCSVGSASLVGTVTLTWGGSSANCMLSSTGDTIRRVPAFTLTGRRSATLTVSKTGTNGQMLSWTSGSGTSRVFTYTNDGIRRVFTDSTNAVVFDFSAETTQGIKVTGSTRSSRVLSEGNLRVTNNRSGVTCDYVPSLVSWSSTCNCATSGSWTGECSDGKTTEMIITGCGSGTLKMGSDSQSFSFDRCSTI